MPKFIVKNSITLDARVTVLSSPPTVANIGPVGAVIEIEDESLIARFTFNKCIEPFSGSLPKLDKGKGKGKGKHSQSHEIEGIVDPEETEDVPAEPGEQSEAIGLM